MFKLMGSTATQLLFLLIFLFSEINIAYSQEEDECEKVMQAIHNGDSFKLTLYNAAACVMPNKNDAIYYINKAIDSGLHDIKLLNTPNWLPIQKHPKWPAIIKKIKIKHQEFLLKNDEELYSLFLADQSDRNGKIWLTDLALRDKLRVKKVKEKLKKQEVKTAADYFHAAVIMQHGTTLEHYKLAILLSKKSLELEPNNNTVRWLNCAATNRFHLTAGNRNKLKECKI